ncbi:MAG: zeta toxin family protein [Clostridia bacterium]|nr:zeta toxin family protein [Clostridia bacterium]
MKKLDHFAPSVIMKRLDSIRARRIIKNCEADYNRELKEAIDKVFDGGIPKIITLAGPTCSGKTTTAAKLEERIDSTGKNAVRFSIDDFFMGGGGIRNDVDHEAPDYDSVKAIDIDYLAEFVKDLYAGRTVKVPQYSFAETRRSGYEEYVPEEDDIYIFEGIQAVYPEVTSLFVDGYRSIFICPDDDISYKGTVLRKDELRFLRRVVRDYKFRAATPEYTYHLWTNVRKNEEENIFPYSKSDININSFLLYEPFIISRYALDILAKVPVYSRYKDQADELMSRLRVFNETFFSAKMVPSNSMFREFIGQDDE